MQPPDRFILLATLFFFTLFTLRLSSTFLDQNTQPSQNISTNQHISADEKVDIEEIPIHKDKNGLYYVDVKWKDRSQHRNGGYSYIIKNTSNITSFGPPGKMLLNLYTSTSFVSTCKGLIPYECSEHDCNGDPTLPAHNQYLYSKMDINGHKATIGFDVGNVGTCGYTVIYADKCGDGFPQNISGFLSLGHYMNSLMTISKNFSLFLSNGSDNMSSSLLFGETDKLELIDHKSDYTFYSETDENWRVNLSSIQIQNVDKTPITYIGLFNGYKTLFDLNTDAIVFPSTVYRNVTKILEGFGVQCDEADYKSACYYTGSLSDLPDINLVTGTNTANKLIITPELYMKSHNNKFGYTLQLAASTSIRLPTNHFVVNIRYDNAIILGSPFLSYYYTHFSGSSDFTQHHIAIYKASHVKISPDNDQLMIYLLIAGLVSIIAIITIVSVVMCKRKKKNGKQKKSKENLDRADYTSDILSWKKAKKNKIKPLLNGFKSPCSLLKGKGKKAVSANQDVEYIVPEYSFRNPNKTSDITQNDIQAYTYQKQNYDRLYENANSYEQEYKASSLNR